MLVFFEISDNGHTGLPSKMANSMFKLNIDPNLVVFVFWCKQILNDGAMVVIFEILIIPVKVADTMLNLKSNSNLVMYGISFKPLYWMVEPW